MADFNPKATDNGGASTRTAPTTATTPVRTTSKTKNCPALLLGRFEIGKLLGHGTFAKVYHAKNIKTNESVAIKVIDKEKILKGGLIAHIKREISILRRVRHPNIVQLFEVMATKAKIYFVMEYVRGGELFNKVAKGRLKEEVARKYFQQLISAVRFCHARGIYHRDLKPENLLLDENGDLKVSDFGLSAVSDEIRQDGHRTVPHFKGNDELGLVQAKWSFVNKDENLLTRLQNINLSFHFEVEQQVNSVFISFFGFNESPAVEEKEKPSAKIKPDLQATKTASFCSSLLPLDIKFEDVCCDHYCSGLCIRLSWLESQPSKTFSGE